MLQVEVPDILKACHDSACGDIFLINLHAKKYLELDTFSLSCLRTHMIMLESAMFAKGMLGMILEWRCHYLFFLPVFHFEKWRIDLWGQFISTPKKE